MEVNPPPTPLRSLLFSLKNALAPAEGESAVPPLNLLVFRCETGPDLLRVVMEDLLICTLQALWK